MKVATIVFSCLLMILTSQEALARRDVAKVRGDILCDAKARVVKQYRKYPELYGKLSGWAAEAKIPSSSKIR
jgi:hypothetical protein